jgi:Protein of unknown function (DUF433)
VKRASASGGKAAPTGKKSNFIGSKYCQIDNLADGVGEDEILAAYPQLKTEDIRAALAFAAEMTRERVIPMATETIAT